MCHLRFDPRFASIYLKRRLRDGILLIAPDMRITHVACAWLVPECEWPCTQATELPHCFQTLRCTRLLSLVLRHILKRDGVYLHNFFAIFKWRCYPDIWRCIGAQPHPEDSTPTAAEPDKNPGFWSSLCLAVADLSTAHDGFAYGSRKATVPRNPVARMCPMIFRRHLFIGNIYHLFQCHRQS
ncbi:uncharacterized protein K489DRAFT_70935 [Dissoconium aciculare CBS 342.82]|uniref:Uncharacterized protein n=1 Tax=Dissoconium aciculare CBS 342.82 TaxID=1314786 RepID=A0A6J3LYC5_9PEZI|nr:uncharacterized protein K489DRAFT_70935 [Dissoconium aciculare CBS 342.82]KAF1819622.1 hypothetical protein K489DRAFT_70935 [Dissoconium aciculare CBS 342.82]